MDQSEIDAAPKATLGGKEYAVLPVAFREVSKMLPLLIKVGPALTARDFSEDTLSDLGKIIFYGIKRGCPAMTYEEFIDLPATVIEMVGAVTVVSTQAGLMQKVLSPGEATGATAPQTGMSS